MTHIHKFRLPIKYRHPNALRNLIWAVAIGLAVYGLWYSVTSAREQYLLVVEADARVAAESLRADRAMDDVKLAMRMLSGKHPVMTEDGLAIARVEWQAVELVEGL